MNDVVFDIFWTWVRLPAPPLNINNFEVDMSEEKINKIWTDCGYFEIYEEAQHEIENLGDKFELYKIKRVREKSKRDWFKVKAWKEPVKKKKTTKKGQKKSDK